MELSSKVPVSFSHIWSQVQGFLEANRSYFEMYRVRAWIWSVFVPLILFVPTYLFVASFDQFNFASIIQFLLSLLLFTVWIVIPSLFLYINSGRHVVAKAWLWAWLGLNLGSIIFWAVLFT